ncbi:mannitol dehydrogenase family protein [Mycolicibacterium vaccae]|uniref:mannitol dehydrogenase family protein n=1 Tax=Mycolicibacterium vaccae TaxID=1810 RepID=UPI003CEA92A9
MSNVVRLRPNTGIPLSESTLELHAKRLTVPTYDRSTLRSSVVHIGVGGFHRAHQGMYLDDVARQGVSLDWGVLGIGLHRRDMKEALIPQDCLYTVVERGAEGSSGRIIGALRRYLFAPDEHAAVVAALAAEQTRLVTLTVTGDGYYRDVSTGAFDTEHPAIRRDLLRCGPYLTAWAYLVRALDLRRRNGLPPFTVMSCDNVPDNGGAARRALVGFAAQRDPHLAQWIERHVAFPATMVDRITPVTTDAGVAAVCDTFGVADRWPVVAEPFRQWVVEDAFCNGRPPLQEVGVEVVTDVAPYKLVKTRLLNGTHCAMSYLGILLGYDTTDLAMGDPDMSCYVDRLMQEELCPLLDGATDVDLDDYRTTVITRLANPAVADKLSRLAARGSTKMPSYLLPSLIEARSQKRPTPLLTLALAAWFRYLRGYDVRGRAVKIEDQRSSELETLAKVGICDPRPLLGQRDIFGDLADDGDFATTMEHTLREFDSVGVAATLKKVLGASSRGVRWEGNDVAAPSCM